MASTRKIVFVKSDFQFLPDSVPLEPRGWLSLALIFGLPGGMDNCLRDLAPRQGTIL
jgi:hypothetical protein